MDEVAAWRLVWLMCVDIGRAAGRLSGALTAVCWRVLGELTPWWCGATVQMAWTLFPGRVGPTGATFSTNALGHGRCSVDRRPKSGVLRSATQTTPRQLTSVGVSKSRRSACRSPRTGFSEYALASPQLLVTLHVLHCLVWLMIDP